MIKHVIDYNVKTLGEHLIEQYGKKVVESITDQAIDFAVDQRIEQIKQIDPLVGNMLALRTASSRWPAITRRS